MNRQEIQKLIPHREPFLWLDEVSEIGENIIRACKYLDPALPVFQGHYPDFPVLPGVLQCEACFQAAAVLIAKFHPVEPGQVPVITRQNNTRFRRLVRPGETMDIEVSLTEQLANAFFLTGKVSVGGQTSVRLDFACTTTTPE